MSSLSSRFLWGFAAVLALLILIWFSSGGTRAKSAATLTDPSILPGLMTNDGPWAPELAHLRARLVAIGLPALSTEGTALHIHEHLDLFVNGAPVTVPADIGNDEPELVSPIHTHDATGIIHVESPRIETFTLGQFFDVWGLRFTKDALGGYGAASSTLKVYVNGAPYDGDPRMIPLTSHEEIAVVYGAAPAAIPSSFAFPSGY